MKALSLLRDGECKPRAGTKLVSKYAVIVVEDRDRSTALERSRAGNVPLSSTFSDFPGFFSVLGFGRGSRSQRAKPKNARISSSGSGPKYKDESANEVGCYLAVRQKTITITNCAFAGDRS